MKTNRPVWLQACLPHGDLDLGYQMHSTVFGHGVNLMLRHEQESIAAANAPVSRRLLRCPGAHTPVATCIQRVQHQTQSLVWDVQKVW